MMRCHDAKELLLRRLDSDLTPHYEADVAPGSDTTDHLDAALEEHLQNCEECRAFEQSQHVVDALLEEKLSAQKSPHASASPVRPTRPVPTSYMTPMSLGRSGGVSTSSIMMAVQQQRQISQQLEQIQHQQQDRVARMRTGGIAFAILGFLALGSVPLLLVILMLLQTDLLVNILSFLRSSIDVLYVLALSLQTVLIVVTHNNLLLSLLAFAVVLMTVMWIRLMRPRREF